MNKNTGATMVDENEKENPKSETPQSQGYPFFFFQHMARMPWPYLVGLPIVFALLLGFGWSVDDKVEQEVANLWIPDDGDYGQDRKYAQSIGVDDLGASAFAALAIGRDGGNMLTAERLALVRDRMERTEKTKVSNGFCLHALM